MVDRQPTKPNRIKLTMEDGSVSYGYLERADEPTVEGTPLNKATLFDGNATARYGVETPSDAFNIMTQELQVNIPVSGWTPQPNELGWYTNRVVVNEMKQVYNPIMDIVVSSAENSSLESASYNAVQEVETFDGYIIMKANRIPSMDFVVKFRGV